MGIQTLLAGLACELIYLSILVEARFWPSLSMPSRVLSPFPRGRCCGALITRSTCIRQLSGVSMGDAFEAWFQFQVLVSNSNRAAQALRRLLGDNIVRNFPTCMTDRPYVSGGRTSSRTRPHSEIASFVQCPVERHACTHASTTFEFINGAELLVWQQQPTGCVGRCTTGSPRDSSDASCLRNCRTSDRDPEVRCISSNRPC